MSARRVVLAECIAIVGLWPAAFLPAESSPASAQHARRQAPGDVVATVGSTPITLMQVDEKALQATTAGLGNVTLARALYDARRAALERLIDDILIAQDAKARGAEVAALVRQEITARVSAPSETDIAAWYQANKARAPGQSLEQARPAISALLIQRRTTAIREQYLTRLKGRIPVQRMLEPPRQAIAAAGHPSRGPADAPIEIIEFSDFECPFCLRAHATLKQVLTAYGERVCLVYRQFPGPSHSHARPAAEASQCADEQGRFWDYHDALFADPASFGDSDLKAHAVKLGLDTGRFNACVDSHKYRAAVDQDINDGTAAGITGTPVFFINGRMLRGAQPFEAFKRIIDEELALEDARTRSGSAPRSAGIQ